MANWVWDKLNNNMYLVYTCTAVCTYSSVYRVTPATQNTYSVAHKDQVICLSKAHQEYDVDDSKSHQILSKHSVDHDDHGTNKFETSAEEEEVETIAKHCKLSQGIL